MAIDFPNSPATNATYTVGNKTWIYDGTTWNTYNSTTFSAETLPGTTIKSTVTGSSLTSVGTLTSLNVTGDLTVDTNVLDVDTTNNRVGIGTASPSATLDVQTDSGSFPSLRVTNLGTGPSLLIQDETSPDTTPFTVLDSGNVGIGVLSPSAKLEVLSANTTGVKITHTGAGDSFLVEDASSTDSTPFVIDASGNVGIGVSSPSVKLDILGNQIIRAGSTQDGIQLQGRAGGTLSYQVAVTPATLTSGRTFTLPNVSGTAITTGNLSDITSAGTLSSLTVTGDVTVDTNTFKVDSTNNRVGILTSSPASGYQLDVEGVVRATNYVVGTNTTTKSLPRGIVAYNTSTTADATITSEELQITGSSFTAVSGRSYKITYVENALSCNTVNAVFSMRIRQTNISGTVLQTASVLNTVGNVFFGTSGICEGIATFSSGSVNLVATLQCSTGTGNAGRTSTQYAFLLVEDLGTL